MDRKRPETQDRDVRRERLMRGLCALAFGVTAPLAIAGAAIPQHSAGVTDRGFASAQPDQRLRRGVNLSHWFAQSHGGYGTTHLSSFVTDRDLERVRSAGFTHVRLPVSMEQSFGTRPLRDAYAAALVESVAKINQAGLAVVVDLHPGEDEKQSLTGADGASFFIDGWRRLALAFAHLNHDRILFELMNEPTPMAGSHWRALQERAIDTIRTVAPHNTLIANPGGWSGIDDYAEFRPHPDANVIYTAHVYEPILFTHQGSTWSWHVAPEVSDVGWPLPPTSAAQQASHSGATEEAVRQLRYQISDGQFRVRWLIDRFDRLVQWQRRNGNPRIYIGEFGVYRAVAPVAASLRWHQEARQAFEARGWGWALWDYAGGFGIARTADRKSLESDMLQALGVPPAAGNGQQP
jgi:aryl-phospho-beta-D-glucosidase BglC (GH1 family)